MATTMYLDASPVAGHSHDNWSSAENTHEPTHVNQEQRAGSSVSPTSGPSSETSENSLPARKRTADAPAWVSSNLPEKTALTPSATGADDETGKPADPNRLRGFKNAFGSQSAFRRKHPRVYRRAGWEYAAGPAEAGAAVYRHRDSRQRVQRRAANDDRYLSPYDGRLKRLVVQAVDDIYRAPDPHATWDRTYVRNATPWHLQLAYWPTSHLELETDQPTLAQRARVWLKWIPTSLLLFVAISFPGNAEGEVRNSGRYDPFPYRYFGYAKVARNIHEEHRPLLLRRDSAASGGTNLAERTLLPTFLCFLNKPREPGMHGTTRKRVTEWLAEPGNAGKALDYLFVAYTIEHFPKADRPALQAIAERAAREQGMLGYWIDFVGIDQDDLQNEVYRINDVVRGAKALVVAVGTPSAERGRREPGIDELLRQWGGRLWTFLEVLLAPRGQPIRVYRRDAAQNPVLKLTKHEFARRAWEDSGVSRALVDHFEGSLALGRLELVQRALQCLFSRKTTKYLDGDHSYALMGLLSNRPTVDATDTAFQAFARLSMANDSDMLLERMLCLSPQTADPDWHAMKDYWGVSLWDVYPHCQVSGIGHNDTVLLDSARAAAVRWKSFARVASLRRGSWTRLLAKIALHSATLVLLLGGLFLGEAFYTRKREEELIDSISFDPTGDSSVDEHLTDPLNDIGETLVHGIAGLLVSVNALFALSAICFACGAAVLLVAPALLLRTYGDRLWNQQPWLFGLEGHLPLHTIERQLFGTRGRLSWSAAGSPLSRHDINQYGECVPVDPTEDPKVAALVARAKDAPSGEPRIFTLVDTHAMTATLFAAPRPPVAFLLLGAEGGMQRAVGCSYDWTTGTLYKEAVLRMENGTRDLMDTVPRVRLGLRRPVVPLRRVERKGAGKTEKKKGSD